MSAPFRIVITFVFMVLMAFLPAVSSAGSIHQHALLPGLQCHLTADGNLVLSLGDAQNASSIVILEGGVVQPPHTRRANPKTLRTTFQTMVSQGVSGGRRGFSAQADDDGDGQIDEDILDGRDNDGDGRIDEDFAAIADAMMVVDQHDGRQGSHLEYYHWAYPQLQSAVFINVAIINAIDEPMSGWWRFDLPENQWQEADISAMRHGQSGRPEFLDTSAFVTEIPGALDSGSLWLGAVILDKSAQNQTGKLGQRVRLEKGVLDIPTGEGSLPVVLCAASSWLQLSRVISEAQAVFAGTTDPISGLHVPWIVSPGCTPCRIADAPVAQWEPMGKNGLKLNFQVEQGMNACFDPDLFSVYGIHLGSPESISWTNNELPFASRVWKLATLAQVCRDPSAYNNPYASFSGLEGHNAVGVLSFEFPVLSKEIRTVLAEAAAKQAGELSLQASYMNGKMAQFNAEAPADLPVQEESATQQDQPASTPRDLTSIDQLTLSPDLLDGYPNPFKDAITIRFAIPQTLESAFKVPNGTEWPSDWDKSAPVPWESGFPAVSVKIYNINGQELRTLHQGNHLNGEFTVGWDGSDAFGRQVASGTYFCKLQLDKWSVTRRVIFLR